MIRVVSALLTLAMIGVSISGCDTAGGELEYAEVSLEQVPDPMSSELALLVTYSGCSGGTLPTEIHAVDIAEDKGMIELRVWIEVPTSPFPTTCPSNPVLGYVASLQSEVGDRSIWAQSDRGPVQLQPGDNDGG